MSQEDLEPKRRVESHVIDWKQVGSGLILGALLGVGATFYLQGQQIATLKEQIEQLKSRLLESPGPVQASSPSNTSASMLGAATPINVEKIKNNDEYHPVKVDARTLQIVWDMDRNLVVQVYKDGNIIFPPGDSHKESSSGVSIRLDPHLYQIKLWIPRDLEPFRVVWVEIRNRG